MATSKTRGEKTSAVVATKASNTLRSTTASPAQKSVAASALRQVKPGQTTAVVATKASKQLVAAKSTPVQRSIAASDLTQAANRPKPAKKR